MSFCCLVFKTAMLPINSKKTVFRRVKEKSIWQFCFENYSRDEKIIAQL